MSAAEAHAVTAPIVLLLVILVAGAILVRFLRNLWSRRPVPLLQLRDVLLFGTFIVLVADQQIARQSGVFLSNEPWWVLLTNSLLIVALGFWLFVEIGLIGRNTT